MADGVGIVETCQRLEQAGADVVGMNCFRGPETMLPWLREIRAAVSCHVGALPIPYRTTAAEPTFFNLSDDRARVPSPHGRTFPTALDPLYANRYEVGAFASEAAGLGINYLGVCCGASPMLIRQVAEAVGTSPPRPAGSRRGCRTTSCTATTSGCPSTSCRSASRPDGGGGPSRNGMAHRRRRLPAEHRLLRVDHAVPSIGVQPEPIRFFITPTMRARRRGSRRRPTRAGRSCAAG